MAAGQFILLDGGGTRLVFDRRLYVGAGGYRSHPGPTWEGEGLFLMYGGLWGEYAFAPEAPLYLSVGGLVGAGAAGLMPTGGNDFSASTGMLVLDPEAYLNLSITEFMRLSVGVSYRFPIPFGELPGLTAWDLGGPAAILQLRFLGY
jgi:hypothetical protein